MNLVRARIGFKTVITSGSSSAHPRVTVDDGGWMKEDGSLNQRQWMMMDFGCVMVLGGGLDGHWGFCGSRGFLGGGLGGFWRILGALGGSEKICV